MEQKTLQCPHCREMNFPMVGISAGIAVSDTCAPGITNQTLMVKWIHHLIDAMFWIVDESVRWWEIGKLSIQLKTLHRRRANILQLVETEEQTGNLETSTDQKQALVAVSEEFVRLSGREEFLRRP